MYEGEVQSVLRCEQCNKPFDKQSTLKRHGYYCRSRRVGSGTRSRSCFSCARGKARCDNRHPECSRCMTKAIKCHYPSNKTQPTEPQTQHNDEASTEQQKIASALGIQFSGVDDCYGVRSDGDEVLNTIAIRSELDFATFGEEHLDDYGFDIDFADFLNTQTNEQTVQCARSVSSPLVHHPTPWTTKITQYQQAISFPNASIPASPGSNTRSLMRRPRMKAGTQRIANLILHTLKSYIFMMLYNNDLPPFIHPSLVSSDSQESDMESLINCINLVRMISNGVKGARKLFWKNVQSECEHLCIEHRKMNEWELLAAMQALSIYILIRLDEGETDYNNFDSLLVATVIAISQQLKPSSAMKDTPSTPYEYSLERSWKEWIFEESRRRLCVVYQVVNMLVYFEPAAMCDHPKDLILAPLPAKKQLWEASDRFMWHMEHKRELGGQITFGLAANGELVRLNEVRVYCNGTALDMPVDTGGTPSKPANWEEWCSGMDGFGGLIMLAASLID